LEEESKKVMQLAYDKFKYSARSFHKYLKVARTFADMEGSGKIRKRDIFLALMARDMDKDNMQMIIIKG
jgi:magnesium chelatase family protein